MKRRLDKLRSLLKERNFDAIIVSKPENRRYFSGFTGSSGMLLVDNLNQLFTDFRYIEQAEEQAPLFKVIRHGSNPFEIIANTCKEKRIKKLAFESDFLTVDTFRNLSGLLSGVELLPIHLDALRIAKDFDEINLIKRAVQIADEAFQFILKVIRPGISEIEVAVELESKMRRLGAEKSAFDIIIASGRRGALPHGRASDKIIHDGELVTMDFGAVYGGYHSDITRTVCVGVASDKQREIYNVVLTAQLAGVQAIRPGENCAEVDAVSRRIIEEAGYGNYFGHGLGHGVGLAIHEEPRLSPANVAGVLTEHMIVTVEPGIYIPDWGGVRIEDTVMATFNGCERLTASTKQLIEIHN